MAIDQKGMAGIPVQENVTEIQKANQLFFEQARQLPGILRVESYGGETPGEQSFQVFFREGDLAAEYSIYELQGRIYSLYPRARLDVLALDEAACPEESAHPPAAR